MKQLFFILGLSMLPLWALAIDPVTLKENLDSVVVSAHRAGPDSPVAYSDITHRTLETAPPESSLPTLMNLSTSVVATTEGGSGLGYSRISVRGSDATRTNVTLNGVTINDAESQQVFWVNLPTIQRYLKSVELQRGIGTSVAGSGAFGASVNMETESSSDTLGIAVDASYGSFNTFVGTISLSTGKTTSGIGATAAYSFSRSDGFLRGGWSRLNSGFVSVSQELEHHNLTLIYLAGVQHTGITWNGVTAEQMKKDRRYNPSGRYVDENGSVRFYDNESDNYGQHHIQLHHKVRFSPALNLVSTLNYTRGDGYYENYCQELSTGHSRDSITRSNMGNDYYVAMTTLNYVGNRLRLSMGLNGSFYNGTHFGTTIWNNYGTIDNPSEMYRNHSGKMDCGLIASIKYSLSGRMSLWSDVQYRYVGYTMKGTEYAGPMDYGMKYNYFNPKIGVVYTYGPGSFYASAALSHKEPSRTDVIESGGKAKTELLFDFESGYRIDSDRFSFEGNIYLMEYRDQLVATGKIDREGYVIKENIPRSYRHGIELSAGWRPSPHFNLSANATLSDNKAVGMGDLAYSPGITAMIQASVFPFTNFMLSANGKYVGAQYCDNLSTPKNNIPAYFVANASCSYRYRFLEMSFNVNNFLNAQYVSYAYAGGLYFPQPGINCSFSLRLTL